METIKQKLDLFLLTLILLQLTRVTTAGYLQYASTCIARARPEDIMSGKPINISNLASHRFRRRTCFANLLRFAETGAGNEHKAGSGGWKAQAHASIAGGVVSGNVRAADDADRPTEQNHYFAADSNSPVVQRQAAL